MESNKWEWVTMLGMNQACGETQATFRDPVKHFADKFGYDTHQIINILCRFILK